VRNNGAVATLSAVQRGEHRANLFGAGWLLWVNVEDETAGVIETLENLLTRCSAGEESAIRELVRRFQPWALDLAEALAADAALAEDVVQESFITALEQLDDLRCPQAFPGWFRQIVRTHANRVTRKRREVLVEKPVELSSEASSPRRRAEEEELRRKVREALHALPPVVRETAELFYLEERSCAEIAHRLDVPKGTVKRRLYDARKRLRSMLLGYITGDASEVDVPQAKERKEPITGHTDLIERRKPWL